MSPRGGAVLRQAGFDAVHWTAIGKPDALIANSLIQSGVKSAVAQWERGAKRPSGPALRLLEVLDPNKPDSPVVQVRKGIEKVA